MAEKGEVSESLAAAAKRRIGEAAAEKTRREEESSSTPLTNINVSLDNLSVDLLLNILVRLPTAKSVFSSKLVCKGWCSLLEKPYFASKFISHHINHRKSNSYSPCVASEHNLSFLLTARFRDPKPWFLPTSKDKDDYPNGFTLEFLPKEKDMNLNVSVEASCDDLLFCLGKAKDSDITHYYVCNPFTREWRLLPPPPERMTGRGKYFGLVCEPNYKRWVQGQQYESRFRAVCITQMEQKGIWVDSYCSEIGKWNESVLLGPGYTFIYAMANIVSHDGKLHWYNHSDVVVYDPFNDDGQTIFIDGSDFKLLPILSDIPNYNNPNNVNQYCDGRVFSQCLGICQESLRFMQAFTINYNPAANDHLSIWELKDYEKSRRFSLVHLIRFNNMISKEIWISDLVKSKNRVHLAWVITFHPENKDVVYLAYNHHIISCSIQSGELEVIDEILYESQFFGVKTLTIKLPWWPTPVSTCTQPHNAHLLE